MKASKQDGSGAGTTGAASSQVPSTSGGGTATPASTNGQSATTSAAAAQNGQPADYSQAWADHYRSIGKIAEAEAIESYIKAQKVSVHY